MVPRWVSVDERMPEDNDDVLIVCRSKYGLYNIDIGYYNGEQIVRLVGREEVTHWMPLPEPPKEDSK